MLSVLEALRTNAGARPLLLWIVVFGALHVASRIGPRSVPLNDSALKVRRLIAACGLIGLLAYPSVAIWYASDVHLFDYAEPSIPAIGWLFHIGQPVYHAPNAAERYAHIYGPLAFVIHGVAQGWFGPGIGISKALGAGAGMTSLALLFAAIRHRASAIGAAVLVGLCALLLLSFRNYSFWTRPEPLQLLCVSAALLSAVVGRGYLASILVGVSLGALWDLKFTGPLYSLPVLAILNRQSGARRAMLAVGVALLVATIPFAYFPNVSFANYIAWVRLSGATGLVIFVLKQNLEWAAYLLIPLWLCYHAARDERRAVGSEDRNAYGALVVGICGVIIAAAKPGAGPYHLIPFLPPITYLVSRHLTNITPSASIAPVVQRSLIAFVLVLVVTAMVQQAQFVTTMAERRSLHEDEDIQRFVDAHPEKVEMGYGTTEVLTLTRPILTFRNNSYFLDQPAVREHQLAGLELPQATLEAFRDCRARYWLIPKGEPPFSAVNGYPQVLRQSIYPQSLRDVFEATHQQVGTTVYFDVWECQVDTGK